MASFNSADLKGRTFTGQVVEAQIHPAGTELNGQALDADTLVVAAKNVDRPDLEYPKRIFVKVSEARNSKWGHFVRALEATGTNISDPTQLVGMTFVFEEQEFSFGKDRDSGQTITARLFVPTSRVQ